MGRSIGIVLLLCIAVFSPTQSGAVSLELLGTVGIPSDVPGEERHNSVGRIATVIFGQAGTVSLGAGLGFDEFDNTHDSGSTSFNTLFFDIRVPVVHTKRFGLFGVIAPEYAVRRISFSKQVQASNSLIPSSESDGNLGLALGTGITFTLAGDWLSFVSTQKVHFIPTEVDGSAFFVVSFGIALSLSN